MAADRIDNYKDFKSRIVDPDYNDFMQNRGDLRAAFHCAVSLFHLADWVYDAHKSDIDARYSYIDDRRNAKPVSKASHFATALGQQHPKFQLVRGIANAAKHLRLEDAPPGRVNPPNMPSHAANTYVTGAFSAAFDADAFDVQKVKLEGPGDSEFAELATSTMEMWNDLFRTEGW